MDDDNQRNWPRLVKRLDVAMQPVISLHGGRIVGFEALLRHVDLAGFADARGMMTEAWRVAEAEGSVSLPRTLETTGWRLAISRFARLKGHKDARLYLNLDSRLLPHWAELAAFLDIQLEAHRLDRAAVALELSVGEGLLGFDGDTDPSAPVELALEKLSRLAERLRRSVGRIVLDDFGLGKASLPLLDVLEPEAVKMDRYYARSLAENQSKKAFLAHMANICHLMGTQVIAKGIERAEDYHACREAGCDQVQGNLLAPPELDPDRLPEDCPTVLDLNACDHRLVSGDEQRVAAQITDLAPLHHRTPMKAVFERFRIEKDKTFFPVVDETNEPLGIVREVDLKEYTYSLYGKDLISNKALGRTLEDFISRCPKVEIATRAEKILEAFSTNSQSEGLIITEDGRYLGFLTASSLLRVINDKNLAAARDQNPLTKLPGNTVIGEFLADSLAEAGSALSVVYLDFDNFKPFNDTYGFRQGDRAILLFADLLRQHKVDDHTFVGHVGGDDFFAAYRGGLTVREVETRTLTLIRKFEEDVISFYDAETRKAGCLRAKDRQGVERCLPLLSASAAIVHLLPGHHTRDIDAISGLIATLKKEAKKAPGKLASACMGPGDDQDDAVVLCADRDQPPCDAGSPPSPDQPSSLSA